MGGADTWRGIAFQAALTTIRALDVLEGQLGDWLDVDTGEEISDYASGTTDGFVLVGQAKTRSQPSTWGPADIAAVVRRLLAVPDTTEARLEFVTDGSLGPQAVAAMLPALDRVRDDEATEQDWEYLAGYDIERRVTPALRRLSVLTRHDSAPALLDSAVRRVRVLADLVAPIDDDEAELRVLRLLRAIDDAGASDQAAASRLSRAQIGSIIGVTPAVVDKAQPWSALLADEYRERVLAERPVGVVELEAELEALEPSVTDALAPFRSDGPPPEHRPVLDLLDRDCVIVGPAGAGKTRSLQLLRERAAREGLVPVLLAPRTYEAGTLAAAVRDAITRTLGFVVAPATGARLLAAQDTVLIIDGASELPEAEMRRALGRDVEGLRDRTAAATVIVAGRSAAGMHPLDLPTYRLVPLDGDRRRRVAAEALGDHASGLVAEIEQALGETAGNPLIFAMALLTAREGHHVTSVSALYERSVARLIERAQTGEEQETTLGVLGLACLELVEEARFALDRWAWLLALEHAVDALTARGLISEVLAVDVLASADRLGLLVADADGSGYALLHDSFRDWLAARAIARGLAPQPAAFGPGWAAVAGHLAELGAGAPAFYAACAADLIVAAAAAARDTAASADAAQLGRAATSVLQALLVTHLRPDDAEAWRDLGIVVRPSGPVTAAYVVPQAAGVDVAEAIAGARFSGSAGPLCIAMMWFYVRLRQLLERGPQYPEPVPDEPEALAVAVAAHFTAARDAMTRMAHDIVPTLADAVRDHVGWRGLRGRIHPQARDEHPRAHGLAYTHDTTEVVVDVSPRPLPEGTRMTTAEDYLREPPERHAATAVRTALGALLEGFDRT
jgi:AAA domain